MIVAAMVSENNRAIVISWMGRCSGCKKNLRADSIRADCPDSPGECPRFDCPGPCCSQTFRLHGQNCGAGDGSKKSASTTSWKCTTTAWGVFFRTVEGRRAYSAKVWLLTSSENNEENDKGKRTVFRILLHFCRSNLHSASIVGEKN